MPDWLVYVGYVAIVFGVVFLSVKLGKYVDVIDKKSNISGAFIGGVMLAAVTSLPELFTSLSAVWIVKDNSLIIGNILGSDLINLAFFGVMLLAFTKGFKSTKFNKFYYIALAVLLGMYGLTAIGMFCGEYVKFSWYSLVSPLILILYVVFIKKMPTTEEGDDGEVDDNITLKQAVVRFIISAVLLIGLSISMTYLTDMIADMLNLGSTFAGALFLGIATSLPELLSSITLCYRKNFNAAAGNILGSNVFNFLILFLADCFSFMPGASDVYELNNESKWLLILGAIAAVVTFIMMFVKNNQKKSSLGNMLCVQTINLVLPALYTIFLLISVGVIIV